VSAIPRHRLSELAAALSDVEIVGDPSIELTSIVDDSRVSHNGALFTALAGEHADGASFLRDALAHGASALLVDRNARASIPENAAALVVTDVRLALARLSAYAHGYPARRFHSAGITGTNGKTTVSFLLATLLQDAGLATLRVGTLGAAWLKHEIAVGYTTPPPPILHGLFAKSAGEGVKHAVMEVSSHALMLARIAEIPLELGIFTNLSRDHLDFHKTIEAYAAAKRQLFEIARTSIFNIDDPYGSTWHDEFGGMSYAIERDADYRALDLEMSAQGSRFRVNGTTFWLPMAGRFNVYNALAAIASAACFGVATEQMVETLANFRGVPGRMERFMTANCTVVVDYAHTPDALERVLQAVRESSAEPITVVFGCGGDRDAGKRPQMGTVASRWADRVIVTSDNPRTEDPQIIADAVLSGTNAKAECILDRRLAIERAVLEAPLNGCVVVAGKGAESEQVIGTQKFPFDDRREVQIALERRGI
jgi:UDP-N-acetylmuramoyl-L-alanyl-D-glutamate--2,6-diaminopimelate ligase